MSENDSLNPLDWYTVGKRDFKAARSLLRDDEEVLAVAGLLLQQSLEKHLKGYLLSKGWSLHRTHDLGLLLRSLIEYESDFSDFSDECLKITDFYTENRYPLYVSSPVERSELENLFSAAEKLIERIESRSKSS